MTAPTLGLKDDLMSDESIVEESSPIQEASAENERLVAAIVAGDRDAEQAFVLRYQRPVRAMLLARSRNSDLAADLLQDVLIESLCALRRGQLREPAKLSSFVSAIARNLLNSHFRGEVRRPESLELPDSLPDLSSQSNAVEEMEREQLAMTAIATLEPLDRSILQMTLVDGLKPGIIATRLGLNSDVVRQRKVRATRRVIDFVQRKSQTISFYHSVKGPRR